MSTETTKKKIKIDNGTTFGRTYTDKAIDAKLPTDLIASASKLSLGVGNAPLGNGVNLDGFTYDEETKTLKAGGGLPVANVVHFSAGSTNEYTIDKKQSTNFVLNIQNLYYINMNYAGGAYFGEMSGITDDGSTTTLQIWTYVGEETTITGSAKILTLCTLFNDYKIFVEGDQSYDILPYDADNNTDEGKVLTVRNGDLAWETSHANFYIHDIVLKDTANTPTKKIYLTIQSTTNTPATTKELLQTLLGSTTRYIRVSGYTPTNDISAINWMGTFDTSKYDVRGTETLLTDFTVIEDSVVTLK